MNRACALLIVALSGCGMLPLNGSGMVSAANFGEQLTGHTVDFYSISGTELAYRGSERYMPGNRTVLLQNGCFEGSWERVGAQICFTYPDLLANPRHCFNLDAPLSAEGLVTLRTQRDAFELRNSDREVPASCPG